MRDTRRALVSPRVALWAGAVAIVALLLMVALDLAGVEWRHFLD